MSELRGGRQVTRRGSFWLRHVWVAAALLALTFIALDSTARLRAIRHVTGLRVASAPVIEEDHATISGYAANQHKLIIPAYAMDGYNWMMQAERMVAGTEGVRVRHVDYDHPPDGREVEWSGFLHWQLAAVAWVGTHLTAIELEPDSWPAQVRDLMFGPYRPGGLPMNLAMEQVAPWTNTVTLVLLVLITVPLAARRFGSLAASLLALGFALVHPFYQFFSVGYFDHHGLAGAWDFLMVACLIAGGAGWLKPDARTTADPPDGADFLRTWLPARAHAGRWFVASAIFGGAGLWESAASTVPAMAGIGAGALIGTAWLRRKSPSDSPWKIDPTLWRTWGIAGSAASLAFYLLEYFPSHFGWNLEVNHWLYALAWLGAGDLLCRSCEWIVHGHLGGDTATRRKTAAVLALDIAAIAALPITIALTSPATFMVSDPFLWKLCVDYILEIQPLARQFTRMDASEILGQVNAIPLLLLPVAVLLWRTDLPPAARLLWRALLIAIVVPGVMLAHVTFHAAISHAMQEPGTWAGDAAQRNVMAHLFAAAADLLIVGLFAGIPLALAPNALAKPWHGMLLVAVLPAAVMLVLALRQSRWLGISSAMWLVPLATLALACTREKIFARRWSPAAAGVVLAFVLVPFPAYATARWIRFDLQMPLTKMDLAQVITRDASYRLRQRLGDEPGVIAGGPSTTTWMTYFGGFKGLGTLYAENLDGLKAAASIYNASSPEEALELCRKFGVTHLAIYSWDAFADEYVRLSRGLTEDAPVPADPFIMRVLKSGNIPNWLRPLPYPMDQPELAGQWVRLFEVVPEQTLEEAAVRAAQYLWADAKPDAALRQLRALLSREPDYLPALIGVAALQHTRGDVSGFTETTQRIRANIAHADALRLEDRIDLGVVLSLAQEPELARAQLIQALRRADERAVRRLLPDTLINLVGITRQMYLADAYPEAYELAVDLLPPEAKASLGVDSAPRRMPF